MQFRVSEVCKYKLQSQFSSPQILADKLKNNGKYIIIVEIILRKLLIFSGRVNPTREALAIVLLNMLLNLKGLFIYYVQSNCISSSSITSPLKFQHNLTCF